jgi:hypothetical protein
LNGEFSRLKSAANSTSLTEFAVLDTKLGNAGRFLIQLPQLLSQLLVA